VIPASAPLITGKRAVVYVADPAREGVYAGREVLLGPRAGDYYLVEKGLTEGEQVVVQGNFKIDSALQILAKPSMMSPEGGQVPGGHAHGDRAGGSSASADAASSLPAPEPQPAPEEFKRQLEAVYADYLAVQDALSHDDAKAASKSANALASALDDVDMRLLSPEAHEAWMPLQRELDAAAKALADNGELEQERVVFDRLSRAVLLLAQIFGRGEDQPLFVYHCPMAFDNRGADWLQAAKGTANPYFGSKMFKCGTLETTLSADPMQTQGGAAHD